LGEEEEEEGGFGATHNPVSRSSACVLRLQQGMLGMAPHRPLVRQSEDLLKVCSICIFSLTCNKWQALYKV